MVSTGLYNYFVDYRNFLLGNEHNWQYSLMTYGLPRCVLMNIFYPCLDIGWEFELELIRLLNKDGINIDNPFSQNLGPDVYRKNEIIWLNEKIKQYEEQK